MGIWVVYLSFLRNHEKATMSYPRNGRTSLMVHPWIYLKKNISSFSCMRLTDMKMR